ncbi:MAG: signal peptidase I [Candidatus Levybacteria bacterium]|nr:signal peptidase I [Candidatus Levybacteria bacterium]
MQIFPKHIHLRYYYIGVGIYVLFTLIIIMLSSGGLGIKMFSNKTNSMSPTITTGSLIFVRPSTQYTVGDIITFYSGIERKNEIRTHRVYQIGGNVYITKGDNNITYDSEVVTPQGVIGKVIYIVPFLGYVFQFIKSTVGVIFVILLPAIAIITIEILRIIKATSR